MKRCSKITLLVVLLANSYCVKSWPPALANCGNTCFLNASIQVLYNIRPLTNVLLSGPNHYPQGTASYNYTEMIRKFESKQNDPKPFIFSCYTKVEDIGVGDVMLQNLVSAGREMVGGMLCGDQEDATEFVGKLLSDLIEKNDDDKLRAQVKSLYDFAMYSKIVCPSMYGLPKHVSETTDPYMYLNVETESQKGDMFTSMEACLKNYFITEKVEDIQEIKDSSGNRRSNCTKTLEIQASPEILMIGFKRFKLVPGLWYEKIAHRITIPEELNIADFVKDGSANRFSHQYTLKGVIVHSGLTPAGGHYYAYVVDESGQWYKCDDAAISEVSLGDKRTIDDIEGWPEISPHTGNIISYRTGYFFVYQKQELSPEEIAKREAARKEEEARRKQQEQLRALQTELGRLQATLQKLEQDLKAVPST